MTSAFPTWGLVTTKNLDLVVLIFGPPVVVLGFRLLFHAVDPPEYGPAGNPGVFNGILNTMAEFGFIIAAALGTAAGSTDLTDGMFRNLVITGRSASLYIWSCPPGR